MLNNTFKVKSLTNLAEEENNIWNTFPKNIFRFKFDIEYFCPFCELEDETISHLFFSHYMYTKIFWI